MTNDEPHYGWCRDCRFFFHTSTKYRSVREGDIEVVGECRRHPPKAFDKDGYGFFPKTFNTDDGCGEHVLDLNFMEDAE